MLANLASFTELKTVGTNFKREHDTQKTVTCELNSAASWTNNNVVLKLTETKTKETVTCTSASASAGFPADSCTPENSSPAKWSVTWDIMSIKVTVKYTGKETAAFRCDVTVDNEASDSKLVYAEALDYSIEFTNTDKKLKFGNGERYMLWESTGQFPSHTLQLYGDSAQPRIPDSSAKQLEFEVDQDGDVKVDPITKWATLNLAKKRTVHRKKVTITVDSDTLTLYDSTFGDDGTVTKMFTLYKKCAAGEYTNTEGACQKCEEGVRKADKNQLYGCQACTEAGKMCPNADKTDCIDRVAGQFIRGGWSCHPCPGGTFAEETSGVYKCKPCPKGHASLDAKVKDNSCDACEASKNFYTPAQGFTECLFCGGHVEDNQCSACPKGQGIIEKACTDCPVGKYSKSGACLDCPKGSYTSTVAASECTKCPAGQYQEAEGKTDCVACPAADGKYSEDEGAEKCEIVLYGYEIVEDVTHSDRGISQQECPVGKYGKQKETEWKCAPCEASKGFYQDKAGKQSCEKVKAGLHVQIPDPADSGAKKVVQCPVGAHRTETGTPYTKCTACDPAQGRYQDEVGQEHCQEVDEGSYVDGAASTTPCDPGYARGNVFFKEGAKFTECKKCDWTLGEYQKDSGKSTCDKVAEGYHVESEQAIAEKACGHGFARGNTFYNEGDEQFTKCKKCDWKKGKYQNEAGQAVCKDVPDGSVVASETATDITSCLAGTARGKVFHIIDEAERFIKCRPCDGGTYQMQPGKDRCVDVPPGTTSNDARTQIENCPAGTKEVNGKCENCLPTAGEYQDKPGKNYCERVEPGYAAKGANELPDKCLPGTISENYKCVSCIPAGGDYQDKSGQNYCERVQPGYAAKEANEQPEICPSGKISKNYECVDCNADNGEYQDREGGSFCKAVNPGYELAIDQEGNAVVDKKPVKCKKGYYSKGSAKSCSKCDRDNKEYQNEIGATYCKICARGKVLMGAAVCEGLGCKEEKRHYVELRDDEFVFSETAAGETLIIPCDAKNTNNTEDKVYRLCIYDEEKFEARWDTPDYGRCPTAKTEKLNNLKKQTDILKSKEKLESMSETDLANSMKNLSSGMEDIIKDEKINGTAVKLTSRDVKDVAGTLKSIKMVIELPKTKSGDDSKKLTDEEKKEKKEMKEATTALKTTMAKTIDKVAASGEDTLKTVDDTQKASIIQSVEALANSMEGDDEPIVTSTLAVRTISMKSSSSSSSSSADNSSPNSTDGTGDKETNVEKENESISLPVPAGMKESEAPKLALGDMTTSGASVAVFSEDAKDMFPDPSTAIDEDDVKESKETDADGEPVKVNRTLNSAIVSLEFKDVQQVRFNLIMKTNTSGDKNHKSKKLERTCTFLNIVTKKWSSKGCITTFVGEPTEGNMNCACDHNTSFAILLSISDIVDKSQEHATLIMFCINMTFLVITFFAIAPFKKYRKKRLVVLQTQLVLSLILANTGFMCLSKIKKTRVYVDMFGYPSFFLNISCYVGVIIVQYLFLVVMAWMTCCAYTLHAKIVEAVKTYGKTDRFYVQKCLVICWLVPAILPTSTFLTSEMMNNQESQVVDMPYIMSSKSRNGTECWVANPWKWISFMIPMYLCLLINCSVFFMIIRVLIRAAKSGSGSTGLGKQIKGAVTIAVTVGVPWIVGVLTFEPIALIGQWLFIILTGLQGPVMFLVFVILQEEVLGTLLRPCGLKVPEILQSARSGSSARKSSAAFSTVLSRDKPFDPTTIDPVAAKQMEEQKKLEEEARRNVYSNEEAMNNDEIESHGSTRSNALLVKCEADDSLPVEQVPTPLPTPDKPGSDQDHLYYECTHFPYDPDAASLASHFPEPVPE